MFSIGFELFFSILIGSLILMLGGRVWFQNPRGFTNRIFFLHSMVVAVWSVVNYYSLVSPSHQALFWIRLVILLAVPHVFLSLFFIKNFPSERLSFSKKTFLSLFLLMFVMMFAAASPYVFKGTSLVEGQIVPVVGPGMALFGPILVIFVLFTFYTIISKYRDSEGSDKKPWLVLSSGFFTSYLLLITLVFLGTVIFGNPKFVPYSPLFVFPIFASSAYAVLRYKLFDIKVIATELLTAGIWIFLILQTLLSNTWSARLLSLVLLVLVVVFGIFLIRSVLLEVSQRRQLQKLTAQLRQVNSDLLLRNRYLEALQTLTSEITRVLDFKKFTQDIVDGVASRLGFVGALLFLLSKDGETLELATKTENSIFKKALALLPNSLSTYKINIKKDSTLLILAMRTGRVQIGADFQNFISPPIPRGLALIIQNVLRVRTIMAVPIFSDNKVLGCMLVASRSTKDKTATTEIQMVKALADEVGIVAHNLTLYERLEDANNRLTNANNQLSRFDRAKTEFLSIASHQLRTPLTVIKGYLSMIAEGDYGKTPEAMSEPLREVRESSQRLIGLINDLLDVSRIASGRMELHMQPVDVLAMTNDVISELMPKAAGKNIKLINKISTSVKVKADPDKLRQVIINLLDNALKYTNQGGVEVSIDKTENKVEYFIKDTGIGISPEDIPQLFHRFVRTREAKLVQTEGAGLGLYVAKTIVEGMGGKIWVESDGLGKGSRFAFELQEATPGFKEEVVKVVPRQDYLTLPK